jgi:tRNA A-37 threonylcarbamoyl transferase component Bud32/tetratricopeptide (TPR) repeat protein
MDTNQKVYDERYALLDTVGKGGMGTVYKVHDLLTRDIIALKHVIIEQGNEEQTAIVAGSNTSMTNYNVILANEFKIMASMRHPNIISVLDYGFHEQRPYFTMPLLDEPRNIIEAAEVLDVRGRIDLLVQLLESLAYLHRRGIIHRDLKPSNVLVTPQDIVQLVDFGLASVTNTHTDTSGTLAYMAPETIQGLVANEATDLFSVGIMAYEMLTGNHPFQAEQSMMIMINKIISEEPDWAMLDVVLRDVDAIGIKFVLQRLLLKEQEERYHEATEVIADIRDMLGLPPLEESGAVRSSYLEAAQFVGRENELSRLQTAMDDAVKGKGSSWLIGGESGVGKSRLSEELRVRALVKGFLVCRGRASKEDGSTSHLWRQILRPLLIQSQVTDIEAATLKPIIPDIEILSGHQTLPELDLSPADAQKQQLSVIEAIFIRHERPVLIVVEDLHWMGEGLRALQHINRVVDDAHIMVIGNFRNDERPQLPSALPEMNLITLERFAEDDIVKLTSAMIGAEAGQHPRMVALLQRETEGNVFFIIQVLRTLANNVARISEIDVNNLPETVFVGGMNEVIQRRLANLPELALPLLKLTAIIGRSIDHKLMAKLADPAAFGQWLNTCHQYHILEVEGKNWSFAHDKIREYVQREMLSDEERVQLHRQVAATIEEVYADRLPYMYTRLIHHYEQGKQYANAIRYLEESAERALELFENQQVLDDVARIWSLVEKMAQAGESTMVLRIARWERLLGEAKYAMRILNESNAHFERALEALNLHGRKSPREGHYIEAARSMNLLVPIYIYQGEWKRALQLLHEILGIYETINKPTQYIRILSDIPWLHHIRGHFTQAIEQFDANIAYGQAHDVNHLVTFSKLGKALSLARMGGEGHVDHALDIVQTSLKASLKATKTMSRVDQMMTYAIAGVVHVRAHQYEDALKFARLSIVLAKQIANNSYLMAAGYNSLACTFLSYWEDMQNAGQSIDKAYQRETRQALKQLHQYAQMVPIVRPRAWIYQSWFYRLSGKHEKAHQTVATAISEAFNHNMVYDEALAYRALVALQPDDDPTRTEILEHCQQVFEDLNAYWDAHLTAQMLASSHSKE